MLYISYKTTIFQKNYSGVISKPKPILIIFPPEEAEIFKNYLLILQCLKWTVVQSPNATNILLGRPKAAPN